MKRLSLICLSLLFTCRLMAQVPQARTATPLPPPLPVRQVSGIVKDTTDATIPGAVVKLESPKDTISTSSNADGIFIFKNVKSASFVITVTSIGYRKLIKKMLNNDAIPRLTLDPLVLKSESKVLKTVVINGTPSITYKTDTVEYRASDYKVRENATVDELLKKMEGMEVGSDGTLTHQGQQVTKARLNGKDYAGGDVAQAIQNLPADIVEKIQVVDDYGDAAARTGIKDGDPQKVLNITTRADRSVGTTGRVVGQYGNDDRYNAQLFVQRIDANQQIGIIGRLANTVNGVASSGISGGATNGGGGGGGRSNSPGTTKSGSPSINYRDQWGKKVQVVGSYRYNFVDNNSINNSYGERNSIFGPTRFVNNNTAQNNSHSHNLNFRLEYTIDSANYLQVVPNYSISNQTGLTNANQDQITHYRTGLEHLVTNGINNNLSKSPNYGVNIFFLHTFKKPKRNFSFQYNTSSSDNTQNSEKNNNYIYYPDSTTAGIPVKDSLSHVITDRTSHKITNQGVFTYTEPLSSKSLMEFTGQVTRNAYDNTAMSDSVTAAGVLIPQHKLDNIYNYSFTESRLTLNYRYIGTKFTMSAGARFIPYNLSGTKVNNSNDGANVSSSRNNSRLIPVLDLGYQWSRTERITARYNGSASEPSFTQIQPFTDRTDPKNIIVGNPDLKPTFTHSVNLVYNNYIPNSRINLSFNLNGTISQDQIASNILRDTSSSVDPVTGKPTTETTYETHYVNLDGAHALVGRYNLSKQLADRRYNLSLLGNVTWSHGVGYSNDVLYHTTNWRFNQRFGPRLNPNDNIEINPYIAYDLSRNFNTLPNATQTVVQTTSLAIDGKVYFLKTFQVNYTAAKSFVTGYGPLGNPSPLVINAGFEKEFFKKKNLVLTFNIYDLLHQNNFVQQTLTDNGFTNTLSNTLSRYFLVGVRLNLQKWSGRPTRGGRELKRRGDGSFIYN